jgi:hypothetical protein
MRQLNIPGGGSGTVIHWSECVPFTFRADRGAPSHATPTEGPLGGTNQHTGQTKCLSVLLLAHTHSCASPPPRRDTHDGDVPPEIIDELLPLALRSCPNLGVVILER